VIFVTIGSMFPFDRLIASVDQLVKEGVITDAVEAQIGNGKYEPKHMPFVRFLSKPDYEVKFSSAEMVIAHAGAGTIALALQYDKPLLVLPRRSRYSEHVNDHQVATANRFAELQHVLLAQETQDLRTQIANLREFRPRPRVVDSGRLATRIGQFLSAIQE
jgi:beta-1,4-N-acetylglucosaminyltransferase